MTLDPWRDEDYWPPEPQSEPIVVDPATVWDRAKALILLLMATVIVLGLGISWCLTSSGMGS